MVGVVSSIPIAILEIDEPLCRASLMPVFTRYTLAVFQQGWPSVIL